MPARRLMWRCDDDEKKKHYTAERKMIQEATAKKSFEKFTSISQQWNEKLDLSFVFWLEIRQLFAPDLVSLHT